MDIMELGAVGELVGGVAVIASLIFVGLQVRHNTRAVESTTHHQMLDYTRGVASLVVADPEVSEFIGRARNEPEALTPSEWSRFTEFAYIRFGAWEAAFVGLQQETVRNDLWNAWDHAMRALTSGRGYERFWHEAGDGYARDFKRYVETEVFPQAAEGN